MNESPENSREEVLSQKWDSLSTPQRKEIYAQIIREEVKCSEEEVEKISRQLAPTSLKASYFPDHPNFQKKLHDAVDTYSA